MRLPVIEVSGGGHYRSCCGPSNLHECQFFCIISVFVSFATPLFKHAHKTLLVTAHQFSFILLLFATSSNWITTRQSINSIVCQCVCVFCQKVDKCQRCGNCLQYFLPAHTALLSLLLSSFTFFRFLCLTFNFLLPAPEETHFV